MEVDQFRSKSVKSDPESTITSCFSLPHLHAHAVTYTLTHATVKSHSQSNTHMLAVEKNWHLSCASPRFTHLEGITHHYRLCFIHMNHSSTFTLLFLVLLWLLRLSNYTSLKMQIEYGVRNVLIYSKVLCHQAGFHGLEQDFFYVGTACAHSIVSKIKCFYYSLYINLDALFSRGERFADDP